MKHLQLITALFFLSITSTFAQVDVDFGIKGGLNIANLSSDEDATADNAGGLDDPSSRVGAHFGITGDVKLADAFGIGAELLYSQQGTKSDDSILGIDYTNKFELDYITIPILAKAYLGESFNVYGGVQPGFVMNAKQIVSSGDNEIEIDLKNENDNENQYGVVKDFDFSIPIGLGYRGEQGISVDARYNIGTTAVFENQDDDSDSSIKNRVFQVGVGYNF